MLRVEVLSLTTRFQGRGNLNVISATNIMSFLHFVLDKCYLISCTVLSARGLGPASWSCPAQSTPTGRGGSCRGRPSPPLHPPYSSYWTTRHSALFFQQSRSRSRQMYFCAEVLIGVMMMWCLFWTRSLSHPPYLEYHVELLLLIRKVRDKRQFTWLNARNSWTSITTGD